MSAEYSEKGKKFFSENKIKTDIIIGRNAVREALRADRPADSLLVQKGELSGSIRPVLALAREKGVIIKEADKKKLDFMCGGAPHQGVILTAAAHEYAGIDDIFALAEEKKEPPFIILCSGIEDPHNLGAIIRTAEAAGAHGVIIPERRSVGLTGTVDKASAGALEYIPVAKVKNLTAAIKELQSRGVWVFCADMDGEPYTGADLSGAVGLVIGGENAGTGRLVKESCDAVLSIPMRGKINSLNASVAAALLIFEAVKARSAGGKNGKG